MLGIHQASVGLSPWQPLTASQVISLSSQKWELLTPLAHWAASGSMGEMSSRGVFQTLVHGWVLLPALPWARSQSQQFLASFWAVSCPSYPMGSCLPLSTCCLSKEWGSKSEIFLFVYVARSSESMPKKCPWLLTMPPWRCFCLLEIGWKPCPSPEPLCWLSPCAQRHAGWFKCKHVVDIFISFSFRGMQNLKAGIWIWLWRTGQMEIDLWDWYFPI